MSRPLKYAALVVVAAAIGVAGDLTSLGQRGAKLALVAFVAFTHLDKLRRPLK